MLGGSGTAKMHSYLTHLFSTFFKIFCLIKRSHVRTDVGAGVGAGMGARMGAGVGVCRVGAHVCLIFIESALMAFPSRAFSPMFVDSNGQDATSGKIAAATAASTATSATTFATIATTNSRGRKRTEKRGQEGENRVWSSSGEKVEVESETEANKQAVQESEAEKKPWVEAEAERMAYSEVETGKKSYVTKKAVRHKHQKEPGQRLRPKQKLS